MYSKKLLFSCFVFLGVITSFSFSIEYEEPGQRKIMVINSEYLWDGQVIKGATYYKIHKRQEKICKEYKVFGCENCKSQDCPECCGQNLNRMGKALTYHDEDWNLIAIVDVSELKINDTEFYKYAKKFLDPDAKPRAIRATIYHDLKLGRAIAFYDKNGKILHYFRFDKETTELTEEECEWFGKFLDLSQLEKIEDKFAQTTMPSWFSWITGFIVEKVLP